RETGPYLARVDESAVSLMNAEQQGAELAAHAFRIGEAADHEFLPARALDLQPRLAASGRIRCLLPLRDDAFERHPARPFVDLLARGIEVFRIAEPAAPAREQARQCLLPLEKGVTAEVTPVQEQQIERHIREGGSPLGGLLEPLE